MSGVDRRAPSINGTAIRNSFKMDENEEEEESAVSPFAKYILFFFNFLFWIIGIFLIAIGSWALATKQIEHLKVATSAWDFVFDVTVILLIIGMVILVLSSLGCVGALRENICLLKVFWISLAVIIVAFLLIGILGLILMNYLMKTKITDILIEQYFEDGDQKDLMDFVQEQFSCCGISEQGYRDWSKNEYYNCESKDRRACAVPYSCCRPSQESNGLQNFQCGMRVQSLTNAEALDIIFTGGCGDAVANSLYKNILILCIVVLVLAIVPMVQIFFATTLIQQINDQKSKWQRRPRQPQQYIFS